jgi:hypothetical protein
MNRPERDAVRARKGRPEGVLKDAAAGGVRARLEERPEPPSGIARSERGERAFDGRRVVREVVDDGDAASSAMTS